MSAAPKQRQPWPMKWIVVAIVVVIVPYTYLTLHYRKPGPAFRPYQDMQDRANTLRLLSAGYQRITLGALRPADPGRAAAAAAVLPAPAGVPAALRSTLVEQPLLPTEILGVSAAPTASSGVPYSIQFTCTLPDNKAQLAGAELYIRGDQIWITPDFERLTGKLLARTRENVILLTVPAGALKPGHYQVTLAGQNSSRAWTLQVK
jgi:hypothetical protein